MFNGFDSSMLWIVMCVRCTVIELCCFDIIEKLKLIKEEKALKSVTEINGISSMKRKRKRRMKQ